MKKIGLFILGLCTIFFVGSFTRAKDYEYTNLDISANILTDGTIDVQEDFTANFFVSKHGIIRDIPLNYTVGGKDFHIEVSNINVQGKTFKTSKSNGNIEIKIGDADRTVIGKQNYPIYYSTYGLIRNFSGMGYAELYWNLVGYDFDTNINKVRAELTLPKVYTGFTANDFLITTDGKSKTIDGFEGTVDWSKGDRIIITYDKGLSANHGITLAIKFPNNYFVFDHDRQAKLIGKIGNNLLGNITSFSNDLLGLSFIIIIILSILIIPITLIILSIKFTIKLIKNNQTGIKKEFKEKYPVIVQYTPPKGLNSAEVGILLHRYIDPKDSFSLVYKWAYEGIIKIQSEGGKSDVALVKIKDISGDYPEYEKKLFDKLFSQKKLVLNNKTYLYNKLTNLWLQDYGIEKGRFTKKETTGCNNVGCLYVILVFIGTPILFIIFPPLGFILFISLWCLGFFGGQKGLLQQKNLEETEKGAQLISHILGYKQFLKACDENKLKVFLQQDPLYFDKTLPYAVVFGLDTKLIKKITPIMKEMNLTPTRYDGDINSISRITHKINNMAYSHPASHSSGGSSYSSSGGFSSGSSFSGGGSSFSSGGGGGGGGGRSW